MWPATSTSPDGHEDAGTAPSVWTSTPRPINCMRGVDRFIAEWDAGIGGANRRYRLKRSSFGNINRNGRPGGLRAPALPHWHPQFPDSIEAGVRDLVLALVANGRWISYTSCAGHHYVSPHLPSSERHVGLLPRDDAERTQLATRLEHVVVAARRRSRSRAIVPLLAAHALHDRARSYPVIDLYLSRAADAAWDLYFADIDQETRRVTQLVAEAFHHPLQSRSGGSEEEDEQR